MEHEHNCSTHYHAHAKCDCRTSTIFRPEIRCIWCEALEGDHSAPICSGPDGRGHHFRKTPRVTPNLPNANEGKDCHQMLNKLSFEILSRLQSGTETVVRLDEALAALAAEREACIAICREVAERYPTDVFPEDGQSLDCKSARMARLTAANIEREITERHNVK